jgi:hypothetical protein
MLHAHTNERQLDIEGTAVCIGCGCDDLHACCPEGCSWLAVNHAAGQGVCSNCEQHLQRWEIKQRQWITLPRSLNVEHEDYQRAVLKLLPLAQGDTGGAEPAASVLLSAYNGYNFSVRIPDLGVLDPGHLTAAMTVILGRSGSCCREPHTVIDDGSAIFQQLATQWQHLNINREDA